VSPRTTGRLDQLLRTETGERRPEGRIARAAARSNRRRSRLVSIFAVFALLKA
jgi:hypothetical protein